MASMPAIFIDEGDTITQASTTSTTSYNPQCPTGTCTSTHNALLARATGDNDPAPSKGPASETIAIGLCAPLGIVIIFCLWFWWYLRRRRRRARLAGQAMGPTPNESLPMKTDLESSRIPSGPELADKRPSQTITNDAPGDHGTMPVTKDPTLEENPGRS